MNRLVSVLVDAALAASFDVWFWAIYRFLILAGIIIIVRRVNALFVYVQETRRSGAARAERLEQTTADLAERTRMALEAHRAQLLVKLDETKKTATIAAEESRNAAAVANALNEKIRETNQRLLERTQDTNETILEHVDASAEVSTETLKKAITVDQKVDTLLGKKDERP